MAVAELRPPERAAALLPGLAFRKVLISTPRGLAAQGRGSHGMWLRQEAELGRLERMWCFPRNGTPSHLCCALSGALMRFPVVSRYGDIFDSGAILAWLGEPAVFAQNSNKGHQKQICPVSKKPLATADLEPATEMMQEILDWRLRMAMERISPSEVRILMEVSMLDICLDNHHLPNSDAGS